MTDPMLDTAAKTTLTVNTKPLNPSADLAALGEYLDALWSGAPPTTLEPLVEKTSSIEHIEKFAAVVPGANVGHLREVVKVIEVMEA